MHANTHTDTTMYILKYKNVCVQLEIYWCSSWHHSPIADRWPVHPRLQRTKNAHDLLKALRGDSNIAK